MVGDFHCLMAKKNRDNLSQVIPVLVYVTLFAGAYFFLLRAQTASPGTRSISAAGSGTGSVFKPSKK